MQFKHRFAAAAALATAATVALAGTASAHVTVDPKEVPAGGYSVINVKVPNERDDASTVTVELFLDPEHPIASVMPQAVPGWDVEVETAELKEPLELHGSEITEAPSKITWSGGEIAPGMFQQFPVSLGRLPEDTDQLVLKAIQTYDSGEVVRWIEEGGHDADHPAATLALTAAEDDGHASTDEETAAEAPAAEEAGAAAPDGAEAAGDAAETASGSDTAARSLGIVGIVVGVLGVVLGLLAGRRRAQS